MNPNPFFRHAVRGAMAASLIAGVSLRPVRLAAQDPPHMSLEESLFQQYPKGTVLRVRTSGISGTSGCNVAATSTFKDGKLSGPGFGQKLALSALKCNIIEVDPSSMVYMGDLKLLVRNDRVSMVVGLCTVPDCSRGADAGVSAQVNFDFVKGFVAEAGLGPIQAAISQVLWKPNASTTSVAATQPTLLQPPAPSPAPRVARGSLYRSSLNAADLLKLNMDDSFALVEGGASFSGNYSLNGSTLTLHITELKKDVDIAVQGENLLVNGQELWNLTPGTGDPSSPVEQTSLNAATDRNSRIQEDGSAIEGKYVKRGKTSDYISLATGRVLLLQENGKSTTGTYTVLGDEATLMIGSGASGRVEKAKLVDNTIVDALGVVWVRSAPSAKPAVTALTLDQIIDMAAARVPDDVIIATIKKSGSRFILTPDQLIRLKKAGVSDDVIRTLGK